MSNSRAAIRYAKAILDLAVKDNSANAVEKDMHFIVRTISDSDELQSMLASPIVNAETKKEALIAIFKDVHAITQKLVGLLVDHKRIDILDEVAEKYIALNEQLKGNDVAYVTTALPLTASLEQKVLKQVAQITGNEVTLENIIDKSIIGGFVLRIGDLQYDASIANKLGNLKREFTKSL